MIGEKLKLLRTSKKLTQKQVALNLNLSEARYGQYESNRRKPDYDTLKEIAKFYEVSTDYLLDNDNTPNYEKEIREKEVLINILKNNGYMKDGEDLTDEELKNLMEFVKTNKKYIKKEK